MNELPLADIQAHMADIAAPIALEEHRIARLQRLSLDGRGARAVHLHRSARQTYVGFGLEQVHQQAAAIEPLLDRGAAAFIRRAEQRMGAADHLVDRGLNSGLDAGA
jgi:hypothetical protein